MLQDLPDYFQIFSKQNHNNIIRPGYGPCPIFTRTTKVELI